MPWWMSFERRPFFFRGGGISLRLELVLADWIFTTRSEVCEAVGPDGTRRSIAFPAKSFRALFLGQTRVT